MTLVGRAGRSIWYRSDDWVRGLNKVTPHWPVPPLTAPVVACCVYREVNAPFVRRMLHQLPDGAEVRLHALGAVPGDLERLTLSAGPGLRMPLLQSLLDAAPVAPDAWVVVFDDDTDFAQPGRSAFLDIAAAAGFDIAGAAIDVRQPRTFPHTRVARASMARTVRMVEVGPVLALSPRAVTQICPFPSDSGMGWGLDVRWSQLPGLRHGYVDATPIRHHGAVGVAYEKRDETRRLDDELTRAGVDSLPDMAQTFERWPVWSRRPPWL